MSTPSTNLKQRLQQAFAARPGFAADHLGDGTDDYALSVWYGNATPLQTSAGTGISIAEVRDRDPRLPEPAESFWMEGNTFDGYVEGASHEAGEARAFRLSGDGFDGFGTLVIEVVFPFEGALFHAILKQEDGAIEALRDELPEGFDGEEEVAAFWEAIGLAGFGAARWSGLELGEDGWD